MAPPSYRCRRHDAYQRMRVGWTSPREKTLSAIAQALATAGQFTTATELARTIEDTDIRAQTLRDVAMALIRANEVLHLRTLVHQSWLQAATHQELWQLLCLAHRFIIADTELLPALLSASDWVRDFLTTD